MTNKRDTTEGWDFVEPLAAPCYERLSVDTALVIAKERAAEWSHAKDPHGYCHERSVLVALIREVERLRGSLPNGTSAAI